MGQVDSKFTEYLFKLPLYRTISETVSRSRQSKKGSLGGNAGTVGNPSSQNNVENQQNTSTDQLESDSFSKHYNKELRVSKDEIPIVLGELNDSAIQFIKKEQYDKSLNLLQKAYGIIDVIDFTLCRRDKLQLFVLFHNMALCYQKMQMLDECAQCIEQTFDNIPMDLLNIEDRSISNRMRKIGIICKLKMQYCAILSQIHRHKDALEQARESVRLGHLLINDLRQLCSFYVQREEIQNNQNIFNQFDTNNSMMNQNANNSISSVNKNGKNKNQKASVEYDQNQLQNQRRQLISSRNRSFSHFLSQQEASTSNYDSFYGVNNDNIFANNHNGSIRLNQNNVTNNGSLDRSKVRKNGANSNHSLSSFYSVNQLEESMSFVERTARKLLPILCELKKKMIPEKKLKSGLNHASTEINQSHHMKNASEENIQEDSALNMNQQNSNYQNDSDNEVLIDLSKHVKNISKAQSDMKNILGYLNQGEWTQTLSIGSIMQLSPIKLRDLLEEGKNEMELSRDSFIQKVSHLAVSYFCFSTEIRFILQMKEDPTFDPEVKQKESEYWHAKSLEISCTFLPGECPLLNHINLSYNKHFAPVKTTIMEDETVDQDLIVVKPMNGIENQKIHPIIKNVDNLGIAITPYQITPLNAVTNQFLSQMMQFNEYTEQQNNQSNIHKSVNKFMNNSSIQINQQQHNSSQNPGINKNSSLAMTGGETKIGGQDNLGDTYSTQIKNNHRQNGSDISQVANSTSKLSDVEKFERLFKKLMDNKQIDKNQLIERLQNMDASKGTSANNRPSNSNSNNLNILQEANMTDFLMDENILADENIEDDTAANIATEKVNQLNNPLNSQYKFQNNKSKLNSIQQSNSIHDHPHHMATNNARPKTTGKVIGSSGTQGHHHVSSKSRKVNEQIVNTHKQETISTHDSQLTNKQSINSRITSNTTKSGKAFGTGMQGSQNQMMNDHMPSTASNINKQAQILHQQQHTQNLNDKNGKNKQRPLSSGIQKMMKAENNRSRIGQVNQNLSMYDNLNNQQKVSAHHASSQGMISNGLKKISPDKQGINENLNGQNGRKPHESMIYQQQNSSSYQQIPQSSHASNPNYLQQNSQYSNQTKSSTAMPRQSSQQASSGSSQQAVSKQNYLNQVIQSSKSGTNYASHQGGQPAQVVNPSNNVQAYDELKRRLLTEYKKLVTNKKSFDDNLQDQRVVQNIITQQQVHGQSSKSQSKIKSNVMVASAASAGGINSQLTGSNHSKKVQHMQQDQQQPSSQQVSASQQSQQQQLLQGTSPKHHLNVYKPTFIINNSFQNDSGQNSASLSNTGQQNVIHIDQQQHIQDTTGGLRDTSSSQAQVSASTNKKLYRQQQQQQMQQKQSLGSQQQNYVNGVPGMSSSNTVGQQSSQSRKKVNLGSQSNIQGDLNSMIQEGSHQNQILQQHLSHGMVPDSSKKQMLGQSSTQAMIAQSGKMTSSKANALKAQPSQLSSHHHQTQSHQLNSQQYMMNPSGRVLQSNQDSNMIDRQTSGYISHMAANQSQTQGQQSSNAIGTQGTGLKTTGGAMQKTSAQSGKRQTQGQSGSTSSNLQMLGAHHHGSNSGVNMQGMVSNHHMHPSTGSSMLSSNKMATYEKLKKKLSYSHSNNQSKK